MIKYTIRLPLELEQFSNIEKYNSSSCSIAKFDYQGNDFLLHGEENNYFIEMSNIKADSRELCASLVEKSLSDILKISSLIIQNQYDNQHITHLRLTYSISKITFLREEEIDNDRKDIIIDRLCIHEYLSIKNTIEISFENYKNLFKFLDDKDFNYILDAYYRALEPTDLITKYFSAFSAIEFLETNYSNKIQTHKLVEKSLIEKMIKSISDDLSKDNSKRLEARIKSALSNATEESRASKLCSIIQLFEITEIHSGLFNQKIDCEFTKKIIEIRNSLFHGAMIDKYKENDVRKYSFLLVLLLQYILCNWGALNT